MILSMLFFAFLWLAWCISMAIDNATTKARIRNLEQRVEELENELYEEDAEC